MHSFNDDRQTVTATLIGRAKEAYNEAASGALRGRESFVKLLGAQTDLRLAGLDPAGDGAYGRLGTTREAFTALLRDKYRAAARENYEDSMDARFAGSGRAISEAVNDLHLVPAYMALGGLDPAQDAAWQEIGISKQDYLDLRRTRLLEEAERSLTLAQEPGRSPHNAQLARQAAGFYRSEAETDITRNPAYRPRP